ncbi:MAG: U32 family peptidase [Candidatus Diapherotrites archaeon]|uniref:U32 family peptidase n=1 Tax=Candidatus Iainarchaeum sp. TaxID=3101447 RepID=A0A7K4BY71_9ARCH|nr:U32 family peptidase [Candidatus Diapherotrites archaeon]
MKFKEKVVKKVAKKVLTKNNKPKLHKSKLSRSNFSKPSFSKPELLSGAGDWPSLIAAVKNGADAVYFGVKGFNMRDFGTNFSNSDLKKVMEYLHGKNPCKRKVFGYLTVNTVVFENELSAVEKVIVAAKKAKVDAIILSDMGVLSLANKHKIEAHLSTQASVTNSIAIKKYADLGVKRIVLARELDLVQIKKIVPIAHKLGVKIECFIHGAMCVAISGRCFLSHEVFGKSANRGQCLQPCRRSFFPSEKTSGKEVPSASVYFLDGSAPDFEKKEVFLEGNTIISPKDMKTIEFIDKLIEAGIDSLKIEGRTKPSDYVATTTRCYREAIDSVFDKTYSVEKINYWNNELKKVYNREFSKGFYLSTPGGKDLAKGQGSFQKQKRQNIGVVTKYYAKVNVAEIKLFDSVSVGDNLLIEGETTFLEQKIDSMQINLKPIDTASQGQSVGIKVNDRVRPKDKVFKLILNDKKTN